MVAARKCKDWRDFVRCQSTNQNFGKKDHFEKDKRVRRYLLVGNAVNALEEAPINTHLGQTFMENKWGMGPYYSWNENYLK